MTSHDHFAESLAAYAIDALDPAERAAFEAHLASCRECQQELADLRRVSAGIGLGVAREEPPAALRARVLERVTQERPAREDAWRAEPSGSAGSAPQVSSRLPWLVAAASVIIAIGAGIYAYSLRAELQSVRQLAADATERVDTLRTELMRLRQDSTRLQQVVNVINAPDVREARLTGSGPAQGATGLALWSQATGLVFNARRLPPVDPGRGYELWAIPPGGTPISLGMLTTTADGTASHAVAIPATLAVETVAVTVEQAGGSPTGQPESAPILVGKIAG
jgi:anti-sigma-K factor RskA